MKSIWFVGFILLISFVPKAQMTPIEAVSGEVQKMYKVPFAQFLLEEEGSFYAIGVDNSNFDYTFPNKKLHLYKYNSQSYSLQADYIIEPFKYLGNKTTFEKAYANEKGFHLLFDCYDGKEDKRYLLYQRLTKEGEVSDPKVLAEINNVRGGQAKFLLHSSENNKAILIYEEVKEGASTVRLPKLTMCDENFDVKWRATASTPFPAKVFVPTQLEVSKGGELFILGFAKQAEEDNRKARITKEYGMVRITGRDEAKVFSLETMDMTIHSASIKPD